MAASSRGVVADPPRGRAAGVEDEQDAAVALGRQVRTTTSLAAGGGPPVDGADVVAVDVLAQRVELGALAADQRRGAAVELAQPGQLRGQVLARGERRQHAHGPGHRVRALAGGEPQRPERADGDAVGAARSPRRVGRSRVVDPAAFARRAGRAAMPRGARRRRTAARRHGHGRAAGGRPGFVTSRSTAASRRAARPCRRSGAGRRLRTAPASARSTATRRRAAGRPRRARGRPARARAAPPRRRAGPGARPSGQCHDRPLSAGRGRRRGRRRARRRRSRPPARPRAAAGRGGAASAGPGP